MALKEIERTGTLLTFDDTHYDIKADIVPASINIRIGGRGCGKSISAYKLAIDNFLNKKELFVLIRRTQGNPASQFAEIINFYSNIKMYYERDITSKIDTLYISRIEKDEDGNETETEPEICGYMLSLSCATKYKSSSFLVSLVILEEFIKDDTQRRISEDECFTFFELLETIVRDRTDVTVLMLSNAVKLGNDYFKFWNINISLLEFSTLININEVVNIIIIPPDIHYIERKKKTLTFRASTNTDYHKYAYDNNFKFELDKYIKKQKETAMPSGSDKFIKYKNKIYWINKYITEIEVEKVPKKAVIITDEKVQHNNLKIVDVFYIYEFLSELKQKIAENEIYFNDKNVAVDLSKVIFQKEY